MMNERCHIQLNGAPLSVEPETSIAHLIEQRLNGALHVAAEVNGALLPKSRHAEYTLKTGDIVELLTFVGGG